MMGRHHYKNLAMGGHTQGHVNPYSGVKIEQDGSHGHLYANYRPPKTTHYGVILIGIEGSAPGVTNQYGKAHDAKATKGAYSVTGGQKIHALLDNKLFSPPTKVNKKGKKKVIDKDDVGTFIVDLSDKTADEILVVLKRPFPLGELSNAVPKILPDRSGRNEMSFSYNPMFVGGEL